MAAAFLDAPQIEEIASKILGNHHTHLAGARIKYIFREGAWSKGGMACKVNSRDKYLHGYDFLIIINKEFYDALDAVSKKALIDHELSHCGMNDSDQWCIYKHDVEDFAGVISRHGLWQEGARKYVTAGVEALKKQAQMALFTPDGEPAKQPEPDAVGQQDEKAASDKAEEVSKDAPKPNSVGQGDQVAGAPPGLTVISGPPSAPTSRRMGRRAGAASEQPQSS